MRITTCGNSGDASAAAISAPRAVIASAVCAYNVRPDPACVDVDCAGPVREDVPSDGLLGEGLTGENDRLKRGLQRRTPTIPLRGLRSRGGGDVHDLLPAVLAIRKLTRAARRLLSVTGNLAPDHFPFCPRELINRLPHVMRLGES